MRHLGPARPEDSPVLELVRDGASSSALTATPGSGSVGSGAPTDPLVSAGPGPGRSRRPGRSARSRAGLAALLAAVLGTVVLVMLTHGTHGSHGSHGGHGHGSHGGPGQSRPAARGVDWPSGANANPPHDLAAWERWTGRPADVAVVFTARDDWRTIVADDWPLNLSAQRSVTLGDSQRVVRAVAV